MRQQDDRSWLRVSITAQSQRSWQLAAHDAQRVRGFGHLASADVRLSAAAQQLKVQQPGQVLHQLNDACESNNHMTKSCQ